MLEVNLQAVIHRRSMVIDQPHMAVGRIGPVGLDGMRLVGCGGPRVEVQHGGVLVGSLDADVGNIEDVGPELLGDGEIPGLEIQVRMLSRRAELRRRWRSRRNRRPKPDSRSWPLGHCWACSSRLPLKRREAGIGRRVELQDVDVVELAAIEADAIAAAHDQLMRKAIGKADPGREVLMRDLPEGSGQVLDSRRWRAPVEVPRGVEIVVRRRIESSYRRPRLKVRLGVTLPIVLRIEGSRATGGPP